MVKKRGTHRHSSQHSHPEAHKNHTLDSFVHTNQKLPPGIKVLVVYASVVALFYLAYLLFGISQPMSIFFGKLISGTTAQVIELISLGLLFAIIYGLVKRHYWVFRVSLAWFVFGLVNAVVSLLTFSSEFDVLKQVLIASSYVVILLNGIIAWYIYSEREFFKTKHLNKVTKAKDKFFVYVISIALIVSLLILTTFGLQFYSSTIKNVDKLVVEMKSSSYPELLCAKKDGSERDLCYLILTVASDGEKKDLCENIESDFYKMTCYRAMI